MDPAVWGPRLWSLMEVLAARVDNAPVDLRAPAAASLDVFFASLALLLPCLRCRESYVQFLAADADALALPPKKGKSYLRWVYDMHNRVNDKNHVPKARWPSFIVVRRRLATWSSASAPDDARDFLAIVALNRFQRAPEHAAPPGVYCAAARSLAALGLLLAAALPSEAVCADRDLFAEWASAGRTDLAWRYAPVCSPPGLVRLFGAVGGGAGERSFARLE